jgi:hypothetical protein
MLENLQRDVLLLRGSPTLAAYLMQSFSLVVPIFIGRFLQLFHDCAVYFLFRDVKPREEEVARA